METLADPRQRSTLSTINDQITTKASDRSASSAGIVKASGRAASSAGTPNTCCSAVSSADLSRVDGCIVNSLAIAGNTKRVVSYREVTPVLPEKRTTSASPVSSLTADEFMARRLRTYSATLQVRRRMLEHANKIAQDRLATRLDEHGLQLPSAGLRGTRPASGCGGGLDVEKQRVYSEFLRRSGMHLPEFVRLLRGESEIDPRPNKALEIPSSSRGWSSYKYREAWEDVVLLGVIPVWEDDFQTQKIPPAKHASASVAMQSILNSIRKGQDRNQDLVLDLDIRDILPGITCSPFGAAPKGSVSLFEDARMIHDLSYPVGNSVNDNTVDDGSVTIQYDGPHALARRVLEVESESPGYTKLLSGDVNGAYRNVPLHADHVSRFSGVIRELYILVIDLACPFGWTLSPVKYWLAGGAIAHLYSTAKPDWPAQPAHAAQPFDAKTWCDDHNAIEADIGTRLFEADLALREAMVVVLGPDAINEDKFTTWQTTGKV